MRNYIMNFVLQTSKFTNTMISNDIDGKVEVSDTLFLIVPDGALKKILNYIVKLSIRNKYTVIEVFISISIFVNLNINDTFGYSAHPFLGINTS